MHLEITIAFMALALIQVFVALIVLSCVRFSCLILKRLDAHFCLHVFMTVVVALLPARQAITGTHDLFIR